MPQNNGTLQIENLQYRQLDENTLDFGAAQQPLQSLMNSNRVREKQLDSPTSFEMIDENRRIFEFSINGDPFKDELQFSKLKIAFSKHGQWFSSLSQDVFIAGTRILDEAAFVAVPALEQSRFAFTGVSFGLDQKIQAYINTFDFESYQATYMQAKKFSSIFDSAATQHGLYTKIGSSNAFGYGYTCEPVW